MLIEQSFQHPDLHYLDHALANHKLTLMRDKNCFQSQFRQMMREVGLLLCAEAAKDLPLKSWIVETPFGRHNGVTLDQSEIVVVPILRAGLVFAEAFSEMMPMALSGHIGLNRNIEGDGPVLYVATLPPKPDATYFIVDPMVASGKTLQAAVDILLEQNIRADHIRVAALIASKDGLESFFENKRNHGIRIFLVECDAKLDQSGYIVPGLGDAGDKLFGTGGE